jgi:secondary thiamine-phosphate synthase enzyme
VRLEIRTTRREEFIEITEAVARAVAESGIQKGAALVFCPHTTAAVTINENADPDVVRDMVDGLARIAPEDARWLHREGNSDGHLKTSLVGPSVLIPVDHGCLMTGAWQGIYLCEFDGPRLRGVDVTVLPGMT